MPEAPHVQGSTSATGTMLPLLVDLDRDPVDQDEDGTMRHSCFALSLEAHVGSNFDDAAEEAITLARRFGVMITFDFNGIHCYVVEDDEVGDLERRWWYALEKKLPTLPMKGASL